MRSDLSQGNTFVLTSLQGLDTNLLNKEKGNFPDVSDNDIMPMADKAARAEQAGQMCADRDDTLHGSPTANRTNAAVINGSKETKEVGQSKADGHSSQVQGRKAAKNETCLTSGCLVALMEAKKSLAERQR